jgi:hypothetical protein
MQVFGWHQRRQEQREYYCNQGQCSEVHIFNDPKWKRELCAHISSDPVDHAICSPRAVTTSRSGQRTARETGADLAATGQTLVPKDDPTVCQVVVPGMYLACNAFRQLIDLRYQYNCGREHSTAARKSTTKQQENIIPVPVLSTRRLVCCTSCSEIPVNTENDERVKCTCQMTALSARRRKDSRYIAVCTDYVECARESSPLSCRIEPLLVCMHVLP